MKKSFNKKLAVWGILSVLLLCVIYGQSLLSRTESKEITGVAVEQLKPSLDPDNTMRKDDFHHIVRKVGHVGIYALLGFFFGRFTYFLGKSRGSRYISMPLLAALMVAVSDEYVQSLVGRSSLVTDVILDFLGVLLGFGTACLWAYLCYRRELKHENGLQ